MEECYKAIDGTIFGDKEFCQQYEKIVNDIDEVMKMLNPAPAIIPEIDKRPKEVQQNSETVRECFLKFVDIIRNSRPEIVYDYPDISFDNFRETKMSDKLQMYYEDYAFFWNRGMFRFECINPETFVESFDYYCQNHKN